MTAALTKQIPTSKLPQRLDSIRRPQPRPPIGFRRTTPVQKAAVTVCTNKECTESDIQEEEGKLVCMSCGLVVQESQITAEVTFAEGSNGAAAVQGVFVSADDEGGPHGVAGNSKVTGGLDSREITISNGKRAINELANPFGLAEDKKTAALQVYKLAMGINFIQGRETRQVAGACLYVACRRDTQNTIMMIDIADLLKINVYKFGQTYQTLMVELGLNHTESFRRLELTNPENLIHRFARDLEFGSDQITVANDAVKILSRMNRDWMLTGRRPAGLCGAALILAARMNNYRRTVREVVYVAKVADMTIAKRLQEFQYTDSSNLSVAEFRNHGHDLEKETDPPAFYEQFQRKKKRRIMISRGTAAEEISSDESAGESDDSHDDGDDTSASINDESEHVGSVQPVQVQPHRHKRKSRSGETDGDATMVDEPEQSQLTKRRRKGKVPATSEALDDQTGGESDDNAPGTVEAGRRSKVSKASAITKASLTKRKRKNTFPETDSELPAQNSPEQSQQRKKRLGSKATGPLDVSGERSDENSAVTVDATVQPYTSTSVEQAEADSQAMPPPPIPIDPALLAVSAQRLSEIDSTEISANAEAGPARTVAGQKRKRQQKAGQETGLPTLSPTQVLDEDAIETEIGGYLINPEMLAHAENLRKSPAGVEPRPLVAQAKPRVTRPRTQASNLKQRSLPRPDPPRLAGPPVEPNKVLDEIVLGKLPPSVQKIVEEIKTRQQAIPDSEIIPEVEFDGDAEIDDCLLTAEEIEIKERIWVHENREYLRLKQAQLVKKELAEANGTARVIIRRKRKRGRMGDMSKYQTVDENGELVGPRTPQEAVEMMMKKRGYSRKINYGNAAEFAYGPKSKTQSEATSSRGATASGGQSRAETPVDLTVTSPTPRGSADPVDSRSAEEERDGCEGQSDDQSDISNPEEPLPLIRKRVSTVVAPVVGEGGDDGEEEDDDDDDELGATMDEEEEEAMALDDYFAAGDDGQGYDDYED